MPIKLKKTSLASASSGTNFKKSLYPVVGSIGGTNMKKAAIRIVSSNLVLNLDAGNISSYPGTGANWYDLSGNNTASLVNSPTYTSSFGGNFILNGSGQYASVSNVYNFATSNQFTAIIWAKSAVSLWNDYGFLVSRRDQFIIHPILNTKDVNYYISTTSGYASVTYTVPDITKFAQYAMTYDAGALEVYHNGVRVTGATIATTLSSDTGVIEIGKDETWARYLNGNISAVQLYNRALSASEVTQNYNALKSRFGL